MKKYKLLKKIVGIDAGTIFEYPYIISPLSDASQSINWLITAFWIDNKEYFEEIVESNKRYRADKNGIYYYIDDYWLTLGFSEQFLWKDTIHYNSWNYYRTKEEADKAREKLLTTVFLNDRIAELNGDWKYVEWEVYSQIMKDFYRHILSSNSCSAMSLLLLNPMTEYTAKFLIGKYPEKLNLLFDN